MTKRSPFNHFKNSPEIIRLGGLLYVWLLLSRRNVKDLLHERGIEISHETARFWWQRFIGGNHKKGPAVRRTA